MTRDDARLLNRFFLILGIAASAVVIIASLYRYKATGFTPDYAWLSKTGDLILATGHLPTTDPFSWTAATQPWIIYQWLFTLLVAGVGSIDPKLPFLFFSLVAFATYIVGPLWRWVPRPAHPALTLIVGSIALYTANINLSLRPMIVTCLFLALQFGWVRLAKHEPDKRRAVFVKLALLYILWGNLHNGVALGLVSLMLFALGDWLERRQLYRFRPAASGMEGMPLPIRFYGGAITVALIGSWINPYGVSIYAPIFDFSQNDWLNDKIGELLSPDFHRLEFQIFLGLVSLAVLCVTQAKRCFSGADALHLFFFCGATFHSGRMVVWSSLVFALILPRALYHLSRGSARWRWFGVANASRAATSRTQILIGFFCGIAPVVFWLRQPTTPESPACAHLRPAIDALSSAFHSTASGNNHIFNDPTTGSCLIGLAPDIPVFIDTRFDFYLPDFIRDTLSSLMMKPDWGAPLARWNPDYVLLERRWPLAEGLLLNPGFRVLHEDDQALLFKRITEDKK